jgi:hypothetical protein
MKSFLSVLSLRNFYQIYESYADEYVPVEIKIIQKHNIEGDVLSWTHRPVGRDGWYHDRRLKISWVEIGEKSYSTATIEKDFLTQLSLLNHKPLTTKEVLAYKEVLKSNPPARLKKELKRIIDTDCDWKTNLYIQQEINFLKRNR